MKLVIAFIAMLVTAVASYDGHNIASSYCTANKSDRQDCYPEPFAGGVTAEACLAHGCCYDDSKPSGGIPWCFHPTLPAPNAAQCVATEASRIDCHPEPNPNQSSCEARGCCWEQAAGNNNVAYCFYPRVEGYHVNTAIKSTASGIEANLTPLQSRGPYGNDVQNVHFQVWEETQRRLHFKFTDANSSRYEVENIIVTQEATSKPPQTDYVYSVHESPFGFTIQRKNNGAPLFNSSRPVNGPPFSGLIFENQFLEYSTSLPVGAKVYGFGEHITPFELPIQGADGSGQTYTLLARDQGTPVHNPGGNTNLYASQPFCMIYDPATGNAHGIFLLNSNAMDIVLQPGAITYRATGGVLDFYVFTGPTPTEVIQQYIEIIGQPIMPAYWSLGFHLCRWGYESVAHTEEVADTMRAAELPQDAQWNDIDYMDSHLDFTTNPVNFSVEAFAAFTAKLHSRGQKYVMIFDPAISSSQPEGSYPAFDLGAQNGVFINDTNGNIFIGKVWPGLTAFPDFFNPKTYNWWYDQIKTFYDKIGYDGMWIDMNEPSNFCNGACDTSITKSSSGELKSGRSLRAFGQVISGNGFDTINPPYLPGKRGGATNIATKTVSMDALQYPGIHYNLHNLYGYSEGVASNKAMQSILNKRTLIIGRSTFPGSGVHQGHWLGDNTATWADLYYSIGGTLSFNMFGIPLVGADICGFNGDTNAELCTRWMQLGTFYGFMRNHNTKGAAPQAPYVFGEPYTSYIRTALNTRYALLPYTYTLFKEAHVSGTPVTRAMFWEFPFSEDGNTTLMSSIDQQLMFGPALLVTPVLIQGDTSVEGYFPRAVWYDWYQGTPLNIATPATVSLSAPLSTINVHMRGGYIIPTQQPSLDTVAARQNPYSLTIAPDENGLAAGSIYLDDGESIGTLESGAFTEVIYSATIKAGGATAVITGDVITNNFTPAPNAKLAQVRVFGVNNLPAKIKVTINGQSADYTYSASTQTVQISFEGVDMTKNFQIQWEG